MDDEYVYVSWVVDGHAYLLKARQPVLRMLQILFLRHAFVPDQFRMPADIQLMSMQSSSQKWISLRSCPVLSSPSFQSFPILSTSHFLPPDLLHRPLQRRLHGSFGETG